MLFLDFVLYHTSIKISTRASSNSRISARYIMSGKKLIIGKHPNRHTEVDDEAIRNQVGGLLTDNSTISGRSAIQISKQKLLDEVKHQEIYEANPIQDGNTSAESHTQKEC